MDRSNALTWSEIAAVMVPGILAAVGCAVLVQQWFGPGIGTRWVLNPFQAVFFTAVLMISLIIGMGFGVILWALAARLFLPRATIRRELTQPGIPVASWYGRIIADLIVGK